MIDSGVLKKYAYRPAQNCFSADAAILLGAALSEPRAHAATAGHDQGGIGAAILVLFLHRVFASAFAKVRAVDGAGLYRAPWKPPSAFAQAVIRLLKRGLL